MLTLPLSFEILGLRGLEKELTPFEKKNNFLYCMYHLIYYMYF